MKLVSSESFRRETLSLLQDRVSAALADSARFRDFCCMDWEQGGILLAGVGAELPQLSSLQRVCQTAVSDFSHWRVLLSDCTPLPSEPLRRSIRRAQEAAQQHYFRPSETCFHAAPTEDALRLEDVADRLKLPALTASIKLLDSHGAVLQIQENFRQLESAGSAALVFAYTGWLVDTMNHALSAFTASQTALESIPYLRRGELLEQLFYCPSLVTCCAKVCAALESCICSVRENIEQQENKPVRMVRDIVACRYMEHLSLNDIADAVDLNPVYLSGLFKKETGINFKDYLTNVRMEKAKELLQHGESINAVAEQVGYQDTKYFSRLFARVVGVNPTQYKKLYR